MSRVSMISKESLLNAGYKQFTVYHKEFCDVGYQKRFDDEDGKKYFITVYEYDNRSIKEHYHQCKTSRTALKHSLKQKTTLRLMLSFYPSARRASKTWKRSLKRCGTGWIVLTMNYGMIVDMKYIIACVVVFLAGCSMDYEEYSSRIKYCENVGTKFEVVRNKDTKVVYHVNCLNGDGSVFPSKRMNRDE